MGTVEMVIRETRSCTSYSLGETSTSVSELVSVVGKRHNTSGTYYASSASYAESVDVVSAGTCIDGTTWNVESHLHSISGIGISIYYSYDLGSPRTVDGKGSIVRAAIAGTGKGGYYSDSSMSCSIVSESHTDERITAYDIGRTYYSSMIVTGSSVDGNSLSADAVDHAAGSGSSRNSVTTSTVALTENSVYSVSGTSSCRTTVEASEYLAAAGIARIYY